MKNYLNRINKRRLGTLMLLGLVFSATIPGLLIREIVEGQVMSGPVSWVEEESINDTQVPTTDDKDESIDFFVQENKLHREGRVVGARDAKLSNNNNLIGYVSNETEEGELNVFDLSQSKEIFSMSLAGHPHKYVQNWSNTDEFLVITDKAQQPYRQTHQIVRFNKKQLKKVFDLETYGTTMLWENNGLVFLNSKSNCIENLCYPTEMWLYHLNTNTLRISPIGKVMDFETPFPAFKSIEVNRNNYAIKYEVLKDNSLGMNLDSIEDTILIPRIKNYEK